MSLGGLIDNLLGGENDIFLIKISFITNSLGTSENLDSQAINTIDVRELANSVQGFINSHKTLLNEANSYILYVEISHQNVEEFTGLRLKVNNAINKQSKESEKNKSILCVYNFTGYFDDSGSKSIINGDYNVSDLVSQEIKDQIDVILALSDSL